ncbi:CPBP family intramembrane glutamic endopeptidase [Actinoplanes sp. NPDC049596]|uniref:CPBP family intramembrane glutamic endopeptidase n=1 Tax=unclassified Actinoplanes TaxID=2626549 RepID=UPI003435580E
MLAHSLVAVLVLALLADVVINTLRPGRAMRQIEAKGRIWFYRRFVLGGWLLAVFALLPVVESDDLTLTDLGLTLSGGGVAGRVLPGVVVIAWGLTAFVLAVFVRSGRQTREHVLAGGSTPARDRSAPMYPRTPRERRLALAVAVTAGVTEEVVHRGLLIAAGVVLFDLPIVVAALISIALFAGMHLYQGAQGVYGAAMLGLIFTGVTALSGSLLPAMIIHVTIDVIALLLVPPSDGAAQGDPVQPTAAQPDPAQTATAIGNHAPKDETAGAGQGPAGAPTAHRVTIPVVPGPPPPAATLPTLRRSAPHG